MSDFPSPPLTAIESHSRSRTLPFRSRPCLEVNAIFVFQHGACDTLQPISLNSYYLMFFMNSNVQDLERNKKQISVSPFKKWI